MFSSYEITTEQYWDCECEEDYIRMNQVTWCPKCNSYKDDCPDSMIVEVERPERAY